MATLGISLDTIAGIAPKVSTLADVRRLLGDGHVTERLPPHQTKRRLLPAKVLLHYPDTGIVVVFVDTGDELSPDAVVTVVGVEQGSPLATADGLRAGLAMAEAEVIVLAVPGRGLVSGADLGRGMRVRREFTSSTS